VNAYVIGAVRTPVGRRGGVLRGIHPADLGAHVLAALVDRVGIDPAEVDDVIFGCVDTIGRRPRTSRAPRGSRRGSPRRCPGSPSTGSAAPASRRCTSPPRPC
jgi:acetyl-CoA C-acetyltransferase